MMDDRNQLWAEMSDLGLKWSRLAVNGTNPDLFKDQMSVHLDTGAKMYSNLTLQSPGFVLFNANLIHFVAKRAKMY